VFSEYRQQFQAVQLQVLRSYGSRVVEAVMENSADFGLTQLPVEEKRLQVVNIYHDEIRLIVPAGIRWRTEIGAAQDVVEYYLVLPKYGKTRTRLNEWLEAGGRRHSHLHGTGFHGDDEALRDGGPGRELPGGLELPRGDRRRQAAAIPLAPEPMVRRLGLIYRKDKALSKAAWDLSRLCWIM
jgi:DNA-binding transcriptional LysR family regulator